MFPRTCWGKLPMARASVQADSSTMTDQRQGPADNVVSHAQRDTCTPMFRTPALVVATFVSAAASYIIYMVIAILAGITSIMRSFVSMMANPTYPELANHHSALSQRISQRTLSILDPGLCRGQARLGHLCFGLRQSQRLHGTFVRAFSIFQFGLHCRQGVGRR
jgi:hypothetical protein